MTSALFERNLTRYCKLRKDKKGQTLAVFNMGQDKEVKRFSFQRTLRKASMKPHAVQGIESSLNGVNFMRHPGVPVEDGTNDW